MIHVKIFAKNGYVNSEDYLLITHCRTLTGMSNPWVREECGGRSDLLGHLVRLNIVERVGDQYFEVFRSAKHYEIQLRGDIIGHTPPQPQRQCWCGCVAGKPWMGLA